MHVFSLSGIGHLPWHGRSGGNCSGHCLSPGYPAELTGFTACSFHPHDIWGGNLFVNEESKAKKLKCMAQISQFVNSSSDSNVEPTSWAFSQWIFPEQHIVQTLRDQRECRQLRVLLAKNQVGILCLSRCQPWRVTPENQTLPLTPDAS